MHESFKPSSEPEWNLAPTKGPSDGKLKGLPSASDLVQELMLRPVQEQLYGSIYEFSDGDDDLTDLSQRYNYLQSGMKSYTRQKKRLGNGEKPTTSGP